MISARFDKYSSFSPTPLRLPGYRGFEIARLPGATGLNLALVTYVLCYGVNESEQYAVVITRRALSSSSELITSCISHFSS